jgi:hypothetical protein
VSSFLVALLRKIISCLLLANFVTFFHLKMAISIVHANFFLAPKEAHSPSISFQQEMPLDNSTSSWSDVSVAESLSVMMQKEQTLYRSCDYLQQKPSATASLRLLVDENVRAEMVDWCYSFVDVCQFQRETVAVAMDMVDRFLSKSSLVSEAVLCDRIQFQLLTMTSLYVAVKTSENNTLGIEFFSSISCELYSIESIEAMERTLLHELSWRISPPTCVQMAHHILVLLSKHACLDKSWIAILDEVGYQAEHAVRDYYFVTQRPSTVAMAAILNTLELFDKPNDQEFIRSLLSVMNDEFDSLEIILATKSRLYSLVYGRDSSDIDP